MAHPELYIQLSYQGKVIFAILILVIFIIYQLRKFSKNHKKVIKRIKPQQNLCIDYEKFIKANFKKTEFLFENKVRLAELLKLVG